MKLSEAMRKGALLALRQLFGVYYDEDGGTCALGAVMVGSGIIPACTIRTLNSQVAEMRELFPELEGVSVKSPDSGYITLENAIYLLNDGLRASREGIADWLEEIGY